MEDIINNVRKFNRFYTKQLGLLNEHIVESPFSLTEARIMYELAHNENINASFLANELSIDAGLLSRILRDFENRKLINRQKDKNDARQSILTLTSKGKKEFEKLNSLSSNQIKTLLGNLNISEQKQLAEAMSRIENFLGKKETKDKSFTLRNPQAGDYGWIVQKNGEIYAREYNLDERYEGLTAEITGEIIKNFDPKKERCWIAEKDCVNIGAVFLVKKNATTAKLRLLIVDPSARGLGIGSRLVNECTRFARQSGYKKITLWTNSFLDAARHIYEKEGYKMIKSEPHNYFGEGLIAETWELEL